ncbi:MAG: hypothetical protein ETSY1_23985 [Candidatus Entotheonella factor]|uniref:Uncharacterized protein n=1 Tax=Entotheonella factor TaxID=1429438 RepID=W4LID9_ENTF1|nr:MAG: hypothetical protein ETSY1_23985 [Candidatus Entotheonella factor]
MPVGIVIAAFIGVVVMIWIIKRRRIEPPIEFRQDTMRYITIDPDKPNRNFQPLADPTPPAMQTEDVSPSAVIAPEPVVPPDEISEMYVASKPVMEDAGDAEFTTKGLEADDEPELLFGSPDLLVNDER